MSTEDIETERIEAARRRQNEIDYETGDYAYYPEDEEPNLRSWRWLTWALAATGLIIGVVLFSQWPNWAARNIQNNIGVRTVFLFWLIGHVGIGFFGGGLIGSLFSTKRMTTHENRP